MKDDTEDMTMAAAYSYTVDLDELAVALRSQDILSDQNMCRNAMKKVITMMNHGYNLTSLSPLMVKLLAHPDLLVKKIASHFVVEYSRNDNEYTLLAINTLMTDASESNPMCRGLAVKTLCSLQNEAFIEYGIKALHQGIRDKSAYVRRIAINSCLRMYKISPSSILDSGFIDELYGMLRDSDPVVITNCLSVLEEILKNEGGVVVSRSLAHHLLNSLPKLTDWGLVTVFSVLTKYTAKTEDEMFDIMNIADVYLKHSSLSVCISCLNFFNSLVRDYPELKLEVFSRVRDSLLTALSSGYPEMIFTVLELIEGSFPRCKPAFVDYAQAFFCRHGEPTYIKVKKIQLLSDMATEDNIQDIVDELMMCCTDATPQIAAAAISKLGDVASSSSSYLKMCVSKLQDLADRDVGHVISNVVQVVETLSGEITEDFIPTVEILVGKFHLITDVRGRSAFLRVLGLYKDKLRDSGYILEDIVEEWVKETNLEIKRNLLTTSLKLFFQNPAVCQESLGVVMESCVNDEDQDLSDCAKFYYHLLQHDVNLISKLLGDRSDQ